MSVTRIQLCSPAPGLCTCHLCLSYRLAVTVIFMATLLMASAVALFQDAFVGIFTREPSISAMTKAVLPVVAVGILGERLGMLWL